MGVFSQGSPNSVLTPMRESSKTTESFLSQRCEHYRSHPSASLLLISRVEQKLFVPPSNTTDILPEALNMNLYRLDHLKAFPRSEFSLKKKPQIKLLSKKSRSPLFWGLDWGFNTQRKK